MADQNSEDVQRAEPAPDDSWADRSLKGSEQALEAAKGARDKAEEDLKVAQEARGEALVLHI